MSENTSNVRTVLGTVTSAGRDKTITVIVETKKRHPKYKKYIKQSSKFHVHDPENIGKVGDNVAIKETRPRSKTKTWELIEVLGSVA